MALHRAAVAAGFLAATALPGVARAQAPVRVTVSASSITVSSGGPVGPSVRVTTTVGVPDGGTVTLGGYSRLSEARTEAGAPVLGKLPFAGRGFRNVGYGRAAASTRVTASVRVIDLREEEYRQTGYRSP
jgi:type II secretory pathway component GspD/PulD (secretin)